MFPQKFARKLDAIAVATTTVAILDACEDMIYCKLYLRVTPRELFVYIASALLGPTTAISFGWSAVLLGVALHVSVSFCVVVAYFLLSRKLSVLRSQPAAMGAVFGIAVYWVMHYLVVPLTAVPRVPGHDWRVELANQLFAHVFMVGIPAAVILTQFAPSPKAKAPFSAEMPQTRINTR